MDSRDRMNDHINETLYKLGYSQNMVKKRQYVNSKISQSMTIMTQQKFRSDNVDKILVGSRREGISLFSESDTDVMFILNDIVCTEDTETSNFREKTVFLMDKENVPPGYTNLVLATDTCKNSFTDFALVNNNGKLYLSSDVFMNERKDMFRLNRGWLKEVACYKPRRGPSLPETTECDDLYDKILHVVLGKHVQDLKQDKDSVRGLPCVCPSLVLQWCSAHRPNGWPTQEMISSVADLPVHVVPVGCKNSGQEDLQWRISFTKAEIFLIQQLNDTQTKTLVLLRIIARKRLKFISKKMSSFVIKNAMLWLAESTPLDMFQPEKLLQRVKDGLHLLLESINGKRLPCYMIPARNLFRGMTNSESRKLRRCLHKLLDHFPSIIEDVLPSNQESDNHTMALLDRFNIEILLDRSPQQLAMIGPASEKCYTSFTQHICNAKVLLLPYIQEHGIKQLMKICREYREPGWARSVVAKETAAAKALQLQNSKDTEVQDEEDQQAHQIIQSVQVNDDNIAQNGKNKQEQCSSNLFYYVISILVQYLLPRFDCMLDLTWTLLTITHPQSACTASSTVSSTSFSPSFSAYLVLLLSICLLVSCLWAVTWHVISYQSTDMTIRSYHSNKRNRCYQRHDRIFLYQSVHYKQNLSEQ